VRRSSKVTRFCHREQWLVGITGMSDKADKKTNEGSKLLGHNHSPTIQVR
jgi:hypothetical protein